MSRQRDIIKSRVAENMDPKRWKVFVAGVKSLYDIMQELVERYPELPAANICNLDETNMAPGRRPRWLLAAKVRGARTPFIMTLSFQ
jgi:hypothetical protein